uniref:DNA topoisomerase n=1 Tax=Cajanus cajan TaxID=3821 RepID=A0A151R983_CAJCA|nr:DNA topoisomerase 1 [Cajanus cajan]
MHKPLYPPSGKSVVVVESVTKAKVIKGYLGDMYEVLPSYGHVRDLAARSGSVRPDEDFSMVWEVPSPAWTHLKSMKVALSGAENLILASDPDREGEAIAWHILEMLQQQGALHDNISVARVVFHEITERSIKGALQTPRDIDINLVHAYLARRALDYLIGFNISPLLWRKLPGCQSAGRVQSAALSLICDREMEIDEFKPKEYWTVELNQFSITSDSESRNIQSNINSADFQVVGLKKSKSRRNPPTPYITSTLQQDAANKLHFTASLTMKLAQKLYEGVELSDGEAVGLITYIRTDGLHISDEAVASIRSLIIERYGKDFVSQSAPKYFKKVKNAQEAHEAIRPTDIRKLPSMLAGVLDEESLKLYTLIWSRTVSCQMESAVFDQVRPFMASWTEVGIFVASMAAIKLLCLSERLLVQTYQEIRNLAHDLLSFLNAMGKSSVILTSSLLSSGILTSGLDNFSCSRVEVGCFFLSYFLPKKLSSSSSSASSMWTMVASLLRSWASCKDKYDLLESKPNRTSLTRGMDLGGSGDWFCDSGGEWVSSELGAWATRANDGGGAWRCLSHSDFQRDPLHVVQAEPNQHHTQPPPRYTEASLVKKLEELGIGRPSTYAMTLRVLQDRNYLTVKSRVLSPEFRGRMVSAFLSQHFSEVTDYSFTADMETELDNVSAGLTEWKGLLKDYWTRFKLYCERTSNVHIHQVEKMLEKKFGDYLFASISDQSRVCPRFGAGYFIGCDQHPRCKYIAKTLYGTEEEEDASQPNTRIEEPKLLGVTSGSKEKVLLKTGPYGFYVQLGEDRKGYTPKRASVSHIKDVDSITLEDALQLLQYPLTLGNHPKDGHPVILKLARVGFCVRHRSTIASVPKDMKASDVTLEKALEFLTGKDVRRSGRPKGKSKAQEVEVIEAF